MRIGVLTNRDLRSPWASTHFFIARDLQAQGVETRHVGGPFDAEAQPGSTWSAAVRALRRFRNGRPAGDPFDETKRDRIRRDLATQRYDALLALHASTLVPDLATNLPLVYVTDATPALLRGYYPSRDPVHSRLQQRLEESERQTVARADAMVVPTHWVAESLIASYGADPRRVQVVEWGANLEQLPRVRLPRTRQTSDPLRLLFVGLDWNRKGGDTAVETVAILRSQGVDAQLTVVGSRPSKTESSHWISFLPPLNRARPEEAAKLDQLFRDADFLIHPARAECFGHVLCEAQAYGTPVIATRTGGIPQCVVDGESGLLMEPGDPPQAYAERLRGLIEAPEAWQRLSRRATEEFATRLNWTRWAQRVHATFEELCHGSAPLQVVSEAGVESADGGMVR